MSDGIRIIGPIKTGVAAGGAGAATATGRTTEPVVGIVLGIYIKYNDTPPVTTDVTIRGKGTSPNVPLVNIMTAGNTATDAMYYPKAATYDIAGAAIAAQYVSPAVADIVEVVIAQANDGDSADVWLYVI